jgi:hypothetical protein
MGNAMVECLAALKWIGAIAEAADMVELIGVTWWEGALSNIKSIDDCGPRNMSAGSSCVASIIPM